MGTLWLWIGFTAFVLLMLAIDLGVFHRRAHAISLGEAAAWSVVWVVVSLAFNLGLLHWYGPKPALEFFTAYLIEKSLSVDNLFVFVLLFRYFAVEPRYQHRLLFWGILGALVMRGAMIGLGVVLISRFAWVLYLFGAFLIYAGAKMMLQKDEEIHPERNPVLRWARKFLPLTKHYEGQKLFVRSEGLWRATPLLLVLLVVEATDLAFAVDSIPAVFGVTRDPFIVFTSNVFAILGLRAFYFLLAGVLPYFRYLSVGLSLVLMFIGAKMLAEHWVPISTGVSLAVVGAVLTVAVVASVIAAQAEARALRSAKTKEAQRHSTASSMSDLSSQLARLASPGRADREAAAAELYRLGRALGDAAAEAWRADAEFAALLTGAATVGIAAHPASFAKIRAANGSPRLADVPPDQDALEFELHFEQPVSLDILTTKEPGGQGAIARFLEKLGEGIQQVEFFVRDVERATEILRTRLGQQPVYPATRAGADGTRVNFFLCGTPDGKKVLIELVEGRR
ncbi:MAG: TerC/Alx family metal homeostasis membrane protein [Acidobacteria bacterium]|nr:TerC/Alx family metal homeostasis membrane protein [Acidobacteriota bacterium]